MSGFDMSDISPAGVKLALVLTMIVLGAATASPAAADESAARQRADITAQREAVQRRFEDQERICERRFVVTACLNAAQRERREALAPLRREELRIDTVERKQRAASRLEEIEAKQAVDAARGAVVEPPATVPSQDEHSARQPGSSVNAPTPPRVISDAERQRREAESLARFEAHQAETRKRREAVDARNARRAASGKTAQPLPVPAGASSPP